MAAIDAIAALRQIVSACEVVRWLADDRFELVVRSQLLLSALRAAEAEDVYAELSDAAHQRAYDSGAEGTLASGTELRLRVARSMNKLVIAADLPSFLAHLPTQQQEPAAYALLPIGLESLAFYHCKGESLEDAPEQLRRYHEAVRLWGILTIQAHHVESSTDALLFFGLRRITILPGFEMSDLTFEISVEAIEAFILEPDRQETRAEIFSSVLSEFLRDQTSANSFRWLLRGSDIFARRLKEGLAIYLAEHSPEKLAEEARDAGLALSERLEKIIGGLEAKSLTIPVALLLAVKEVQQGAGFTALNCVIAVSAISYGVTMRFVDQSQSTLLKLLQTTITSTTRELLDKGLDESNPVLKEFFSGLNLRLQAATRGSFAMSIASWVPALCVLAAMFFGTAKPLVSDPLIGGNTLPSKSATSPTPASSSPVAVPNAAAKGLNPSGTQNSPVSAPPALSSPAPSPPVKAISPNVPRPAP